MKSLLLDLHLPANHLNSKTLQVMVKDAPDRATLRKEQVRIRTLVGSSPTVRPLLLKSTKTASLCFITLKKTIFPTKRLARTLTLVL